MSRHRKLVCARCDRYRWHRARQLCEPCHMAVIAAGTIDDWPRFNWRGDDLLTEWQFLARQGHNRQQAADRLGITKDRLDKAIERQRRRERESIDQAARQLGVTVGAIEKACERQGKKVA